jgi:hypothetical protein
MWAPSNTTPAGFNPVARLSNTAPWRNVKIKARDHEDVRGEAAWANSGLVDRSDPATIAVAKLIIEFAKAAELDPERPCTLALQQLSK